MTTELFIGCLLILTLAAVIIVAMTTNDRVVRPDNQNTTDRSRESKKQSNSKR